MLRDMISFIRKVRRNMILSIKSSGHIDRNKIEKWTIPDHRVREHSNWSYIENSRCQRKK